MTNLNCIRTPIWANIFEINLADVYFEVSAAPHKGGGVSDLNFKSIFDGAALKSVFRLFV